MRNGRILILDDEWAICEMLKTRLTRKGFEVRTARSEGEFRQRFAEERPDLLIMDIWLGSDGNGTYLYDEVAGNGSPRLPVIFISALVDEGTPPKHAPNAGRMALFGKPFDFDLLLEEIQRLIQTARAEKA